MELYVCFWELDLHTYFINQSNITVMYARPHRLRQAVWLYLISRHLENLEVVYYSTYMCTYVLVLSHLLGWSVCLCHKPPCQPVKRPCCCRIVILWSDEMLSAGTQRRRVYFPERPSHQSRVHRSFSSAPGEVTRVSFSTTAEHRTNVLETSPLSEQAGVPAHCQNKLECQPIVRTSRSTSPLSQTGAPAHCQSKQEYQPIVRTSRSTSQMSEQAGVQPIVRTSRNRSPLLE